MNQTTTGSVSATNNNLEVQSTSINILTLIKRLFGCLGNVNTIKDPLIHKKIFEFIYNKWERLGKVIFSKQHPSTFFVPPQSLHG